MNYITVLVEITRAFFGCLCYKKPLFKRLYFYLFLTNILGALMTKFIIVLIAIFSIYPITPSIASDQMTEEIEGKYSYSEPCGPETKMEGYSNKLEYDARISRISPLKNQLPLFLVEIDSSSCGPAHMVSFQGVGWFYYDNHDDASDTLIVFPYFNEKTGSDEKDYTACYLKIKKTNQGILIYDRENNDCKKLFLGGARTNLTSPGPIKKILATTKKTLEK